MIVSSIRCFLQMSKASYARMLKSSSLIGGAQGVNILIGMVRVKFVAMLIGPVGVGLVGTYRATIQLIGTFTGLGLQSSAVRDIAEAVGSGDDEKVGRIILTVRRMCWLTGCLGALLTALFSTKLSLLTFNDTDHALEITLVGLTILFTNVQGGQMAIIQGMRRIGDLAQLNLIGVILGSIVSVGIYALLGQSGIVPAIIILGLIQLVVSWWFARKVEVLRVQMTWRESFRAAGGMVQLGLALMWSSLMVAGVAYLTRILLVREIDLVAVGIFTAAFSLSGMIVNFVLRAMGADYYPSLTAISSDHKKMSQLVNQQTEIGLLLAIPGLLGTLALAPWMIKLFYTSDFWQAAELLRWFALGCLGRVISWPIGYVMLAKGKSAVFAGVQTLFNAVHICLILIGIKYMGLVGVSVAFFGLYMFSTVTVYMIARSLIGFSWSRSVWSLLGIMVPVIFVTFVSTKVTSDVYSTLVGLVATMGVSVLCLRGLTQRLGPEHQLCRVALRIPLLNRIMANSDVGKL